MEDAREGGGVIMGTGKFIGCSFGVDAVSGLVSESDELAGGNESGWRGSLDGGRRGRS